MTRLTIAQPGNNLTFRPVTSSITRRSKDGDVPVVIMLFGTHYNISMDGILQKTESGPINSGSQEFSVNGGELEIVCRRKTNELGVAKLKGTFSSFMYFYPGLKIEGHLKLDETSHGLPVPEFSGKYVFKDLLNENAIIFELVREQDNIVFSFKQVNDAGISVLYTEDLARGTDEFNFEMEFFTNGKSKLYKHLDYGTTDQSRSRVWIGDITAKVGECNVTIENSNSENVLRKVSSDYLFLKYNKIFTKFDRDAAERFIGKIAMFDTVTEGIPVEDNWHEVRTRDYNFTGDRVIENGMIRIIIRSSNPVIEIYGWNYHNYDPSWELVQILKTESDAGHKSLRVQNIVFEVFSKLQVKFDVNFGTSRYSVIMSRGNPYITLLNTEKKKINLEIKKNRIGADFADSTNDYSLVNTALKGTASDEKTGGTGSEEISGFTMKDNYFGFYNHDANNEVTGFVSNFLAPTLFNVTELIEGKSVVFQYTRSGNVFALGVLPSFPSNLVGGVPFPFVVGKQDDYIKWRANEAILSFNHLETIKRR